MAKHLAKTLGYTYIDSGAMYRAVTLYALNNGLIQDGKIDETALKQQLPLIQIDFVRDETGMPQTYLNGENVERAIRSLEVSNMVSQISALPFVREALVEKQREYGKKGGVVMDGRDIGTVVFPHADLKIFVVADPEIRAQRRYEELVEKGQPEPYEEILQNIQLRDKYDQQREVSPLRKAADALLMDNGKMNIEQQDAWLLERVKQVCHGSC